MPPRTTTRHRTALLAVLAAALAAPVSIAAAPASAGLTPATTSPAPATARVALTAGVSASTLPPLSPVDQRIQTKLTARSTDSRLGPDLAAMVTDAATGQVLWSRTPTERQLPASNTKIVTAVNALQVFGPSYRFTTKVVKGGYWRHVVLVGGGDPSLSGADLDALATVTAKAVRSRGVRRVTVFVDDSLFPRPSLAVGWGSSYVPTDVSAVRALVVNRHRVSDTSIDAGKVFARRLAAHGVRVRAVTRGRAPSGARVIGAVKGHSLQSIVAHMLRYSDNDHAEALHRLVAVNAGYPATWSGAATAQRTVLGRLGVDLGSSSLYDGSGLSRADRLTPEQLVQVLALVFDGGHPRLASLQHNAFPIAGRTGTLAANYLRYATNPSRCAVGLIEAKTGSLRGVITLSGFARGADGQTKLFSVLLNRVPSTLTTRQAVDRLASTITGCW